MKEYWVCESKEMHPESLRILNEFLWDKKLANMSKNTIRSYSWFLIRFLVFINKPVTELCPADISNWVNEKCGNYKKSTIKMQLTIASSFSTFCQREGFLDKKVYVKSYLRPRLPKPIPKFRGQEELALLRIASEKRCLRDRVIFEFLLTSGCRVSEAVGLNMEDLDLENRTATVMGKGQKFRIVHFSEKCAMLFEKLLKNHPKDNPAVFLNKYGDRLGIKGFQYSISKIGELAGLPRKLTPHQFRHTFATDLINKGADLGFISAEMGHKKISTTTIYAQASDERVAAEYRRCMG